MSFFFWPLYCLFFFDLRLLIALLVSSIYVFWLPFLVSSTYVFWLSFLVSSIYVFWLPLWYLRFTSSDFPFWYLQTFLTRNLNIMHRFRNNVVGNHVVTDIFLMWSWDLGFHNMAICSRRLCWMCIYSNNHPQNLIQRSSNTNPTKNRARTHVVRKDKLFLLH